MIVNIRGLFAGIFLPIAYRLVLSSRWCPGLTFSYDDWIEEHGGGKRPAPLFDPYRQSLDYEHWRNGFGCGILVWILLIIAVSAKLALLVKEGIIPVAACLVVALFGAGVAGLVLSRRHKKARVMDRIADLEREKMAIAMAYAKRKGWGRKEIKVWMVSSNPSSFGLDEDMMHSYEEYKRIDSEIEGLKRSVR
jgi:hypothetical protein